ncbi:MAG: hypothetical protein WAW23_03670 [Candidatus Methanoperedens sp.]
MYWCGGTRGIEREPDRVVQFERFGFVRIDGVGGDGGVEDFIVFVLAAIAVKLYIKKNQK